MSSTVHFGQFQAPTVRRHFLANHTTTSEGAAAWITHPQLGIQLVPRIDRYQSEPGYWKTRPARDGQGRVIYVLPGGRDYIPEDR